MPLDLEELPLRGISVDEETRTECGYTNAFQRFSLHTRKGLSVHTLNQQRLD